jgi:putative ABC transport system ATP-binding protein
MGSTSTFPGDVNDCQSPDADHYLRLDRLSKTYLEGEKRRVVLHDTTVCFRKGEFVAILGKSGSGKTTLLNLISGIDLADQGSIVLGGQDLTALDDHQRTLFRRQNIGFIFQFFNLIPTLSVIENVLLPLELNGWSNGNGRKRAEEMLDAVDLLNRAGTFPDRLSGGEQQRVAIARALVHNPLLVLADEPTGNLDDGTGKQVMDLLDQLTRKSGRNLILVTHSPEAAAFADRVLMLKDGQLLETTSAL